MVYDLPNAGITGVCTHWEMSGPYEKQTVPRSPLLDVPFEPETAPGQVAWSAFDEDNAVVNLGRLLGGDHRVAYLRTIIHAPSDLEARLELGSDDGIKVWFNGELVHVNEVLGGRGHRFPDDVVNVNLKGGSNLLMLKITQFNQGWAASARVVSRDGEPLEGVTFSNRF